MVRKVWEEGASRVACRNDASPTTRQNRFPNFGEPMISIVYQSIAKRCMRPVASIASALAFPQAAKSAVRPTMIRIRGITKTLTF